MNENIFGLIRLIRGYSAKHVAMKLGVSQAYIHAIECGDRTPSDKLLVEYLGLLGITENIMKKFARYANKGYDREHQLLYLLKQILNE